VIPTASIAGALAGGATRAFVDDAWLVLEASLVAPAPSCPWSLLAWNAALPAEVRLALPAVASGALLRADIACEPDETLDDRIAAAAAGLRVAMRRLAGVSTAGETRAEPLVPLATIAASAAARASGPRACGRYYRAASARSSRACGTIAVDLDVPGAFHQATVTPGPGGGIVAEVSVLDARLDATSAFARRRHAVARLLLRIGGMIRLVRAVATAGEASAPGFQVVTRADGAELAFGLGALALACRLGVAVTALAHDEAAATVYLQQTGASVIRTAA
jgi:hypothetical protein